MHTVSLPTCETRHLHLVALILLALPVSASADVDPASDVLLFQNEYFPRVQPPSAELKGTLTALTDEANKADYGIKVAIIGARLDLGGVPQLYRHPDQYAKYLGLELQAPRAWCSRWWW